ncbi:SLBB domain-containing protein [Hydrogenophaga soli]
MTSSNASSVFKRLLWSLVLTSFWMVQSLSVWAWDLKLAYALENPPAPGAVPRGPAPVWEDPLNDFILALDQPQVRLQPAAEVPAPAPVAAPAPAPVADAVLTPTAAPAARPNREQEAPLGVGDQIAITVFGQPDLSAEVTVGETGFIMVPLIGTLNVLNLSAAQLETLVARRLKEGGYLKNPGVSVQIRQLRSQQVSVMGEVQRPGRYPLQGRMTVLEALATAGGLTQRADRQVMLLRKPDTPASGDLGVREEIRIQLDTTGGGLRGQLDATLKNDDVVFVGVQKQFYVLGEVRRPGAYPMEPGMNVMKALSIGGGITERGSSRRIKIHRTDEQKVSHEQPATLTTPVEPDDVIHVDERLF